MRRNSFKQSAYRNSQSYVYYYNRLLELAMSCFKWKNLPDTIDERFLELTLITDGHALLFKDEVLGFLALKSANAGNFNIYDVPMSRRAYASNGYHKDLTNTNSVIVYNNYLRQGLLPIIEMYAYKLYEVDRTRDVNIHGQKTPILIICDEAERLTLENLYKEYDGNEPVIHGNKKNLNEDIKVLNTGVPYLADKLTLTLNALLTEALAYIGIPASNFFKKERLITAEMENVSESVIASRYSRLEARKQACEEFNRMFGLTGDYAIDCEFRSFHTDDTGLLLSGEKGVEENISE